MRHILLWLGNSTIGDLGRMMIALAFLLTPMLFIWPDLLSVLPVLYYAGILLHAVSPEGHFGR